MTKISTSITLDRIKNQQNNYFSFCASKNTCNYFQLKQKCIVLPFTNTWTTKKKREKTVILLLKAGKLQLSTNHLYKCHHHLDPPHSSFHNNKKKEATKNGNSVAWHYCFGSCNEFSQVIAFNEENKGREINEELKKRRKKINIKSNRHKKMWKQFQKNVNIWL